MRAGFSTILSDDVSAVPSKNMPHLNGAGESQHALHDRYKTIA